MKTLYIYTDGSHFKGSSGRLGIGGVLVDLDHSILPHGKCLGSFSLEIQRSFMEVHYGTSDTSNPTMEILAALQALDEFKDSLKDADLIIMKQDYMGVSEWMKGNWRINKPYIKKIHSEISEKIKKEGLLIDWQWVKGHQKQGTLDAYWNDIVDKLAKGEIHEVG